MSSSPQPLHNDPAPTKRDTFVSGVGAFTATLGSAIGLGNIWKFPYLTGSKGGAAFVLMYLICVVLVGIPIMVAEHVIGRKTRMNAIHAYGSIVPGKKGWSVIGWAGCVAAVLVMAFYTDVAGWVFAYIFKSVQAFARGSVLRPADFTSLASGTWVPLLWQGLVIALTTGVLATGVSKGIERITKVLMPLLLLLLVACVVRALTLPGAYQGVVYLFAVDRSKITGAALLAALGLAFFKLSLGMGAMTTYGSYLPENTRIVPNAVRVALADTFVSLLAGLAIFPTVFAFGGAPAGGPGLLFETIPLVFSKMPGGGIFTTLFFVLAAIATMGAMISLMEVPVAWICEKTKRSRLHAGILTGLVMFALGTLATLSQSPVLGSVKMAGKNFFELFDFLSSNVLLPLGGVGISLVAGWFMKRQDFLGELRKGYSQPQQKNVFLRWLVRYLAPLLIVVILLHSLGILKLK